MNSGRLVSIQVGIPTVYQDSAGAWSSGIAKQTVGGVVAVTKLGLAGDGQADRTHHGGVDKAVLAYADAHYPPWREELGARFPRGGFGENLTIDGLDESRVSIGDVYAIGTTVLQVSQPRQPCWKLGRRWQRPDLPKRVLATNRCGWYLRVLTPGEIEAGQPVVLVEKPHPEWTIVAANDVMYRRVADEELSRLTRELHDLAGLSKSWRSELAGRFEKALEQP